MSTYLLLFRKQLQQTVCSKNLLEDRWTKQKIGGLCSSQHGDTRVILSSANFASLCLPIMDI